MGMTGDESQAKISSVWARSGYRRLWLARTASQRGDTFNTVALALLVLQLTGSGLGVSAVVVAEIMPVLLLAPLAGTIVDRLPRVRVMIMADLARVVLAAALVLAAGSVWAVYGIAFGMSAAVVFFNPAASSVLPTLVDDEQLLRANSGIWTAAVVSQIALAPLAGLLVARAGFTPAFLINAASFAASAVVLTGLRLPQPPRPTSRQGWLADTGAGLSILAKHRLLRAIVAGQLLAALSAGATSALLVVYASQQLHLQGPGYGLMLAVIGLGAATGPLLLTRVRNPRRAELVFGPYLLRAAVDTVLAATQTPAVAIGALAGYGIGTSTGVVPFNSLLQAETADQMRGRVFATFDLLWQLGRLISLILGGVLADTLGIQAVYYTGAILLAAGAAAGWTGLHLHRTSPT
jgi:predicted MFS family arabinose efflux permease